MIVRSCSFQVRRHKRMNYYCNLKNKIQRILTSTCFANNETSPSVAELHFSLIQSTSSHPVFLSSILILSSHKNHYCDKCLMVCKSPSHAMLVPNITTKFKITFEEYKNRTFFVTGCSLCQTCSFLTKTLLYTRKIKLILPYCNPPAPRVPTPITPLNQVGLVDNMKERRETSLSLEESVRRRRGGHCPPSVT
jgi:hypothetical protein